ncbi:MAG: hypothetical protein JRJ37_08115 [Deltaproteobacteria bacterium]|nr:hypothetical protein [Deltaproteobacteria bacterium]
MFTNRIVFAVSCCFLLLAGMTAYAAPEDMGGWEEDGAYNQLYKATELDKFKGNVQKIIEIVPMKGMATGVGLIMKDGDGDKVVVHIGPKSFLGDSIGIKRGERIKVKGSWAEIDGKDVFMASKIKKGDFFELKVRLTKNGKPFWAMDPEELAKERASK